MKNNLFAYFIVVAVLALSMTSCAKWQAQHQIDALESLVEQVEQKGANFTSDEWSKTSTIYYEICNKISQYEYTDEQLQEIGRLKARYYVACAKGALGGGLLNGIFQQATGVLDGLMDGVDDALEEAIDGLSTTKTTVQEETEEAEKELDEALDELEALFE